MGNTPGKKDDAMLRSLQQNLPVIRKAAKLSAQASAEAPKEQAGEDTGGGSTAPKQKRD